MLRTYWPGMLFALVSLSVFGIWVGYTEYGWFAESQHTGHEVHYHAGFQIYQDGELIDFSDPAYMYLGSCGDMGSGDSIQDQVHLHNEIGDVVHVHAPQITWADMFESLGLADQVSEVTAMSLDGEVKPVEMDAIIAPYQSAVFVIGSGEITRLDDDRVTEEHIRKVEDETLSCS